MQFKQYNAQNPYVFAYFGYNFAKLTRFFTNVFYLLFCGESVIFVLLLTLITFFL